ncbi:type IV pilus modification PilV family protein [Deinococcus aquatilis]|uniref:type IV pilus modification PilV family protein n=1 Tax=Deinococcus aquatilis TaxID=519440 RepID=UPI000367771D|nr:type II secretion system protein [Deinococcus aquatilis]
MSKFKHLQQGFSLVELLVTLAILGIIIGVMLTAIASNTQLNTKTEQSAQATVAAQQVLDDARTSDPSSMPLSGAEPTETVNVGGRNYKVTLRYCVPTPNYCSGNARQIQVTVQYGSKTIFTVETVFTNVNSTVDNN